MWNYVVLSCLQSVFQHNKISQHCPFYWIKKTLKFCQMSLAKDKQVKLKVLPLEYASQNQPNPSKRRDLIGKL